MADEKNFENQIKRWFHKIGIYPAGYGEDQMQVQPVGWYTKIWGGGYQKAGIPDILCCIDGMFVAVEVKAQNGRPSELQKLNTNRIRDSGGNAVFLYPSGFEIFQVDVRELMLGHIEKLKEVYK